MSQRYVWRIARPVTLLAICSLAVLMTVLSSQPESGGVAPGTVVLQREAAAPAGSLDAGSLDRER